MIAPLAIALLALGRPASAPSAEREAEPILAAPLPAPLPASPGLAWRGADVEVEEFARQVEDAAARGDPLLLARLVRLWNLGALIDRPERIERAIQSVRSSKRADALSRAHADHLYGRLLIGKGELEEAAAVRRGIGLLTDGWIIGPFENAAGRGHEEAFGPETEIQLDEPALGKDRPLKWRRIGPVSPYGVFHVVRLVHPPEDGTAYLLFAVRSAAQRPVTIRVGATDRLKVFLNGAKVRDVDAERRAELDQEALPVILPAGWSTILVKSSWSGRDGEVLVRLTDADGAPIAGVETSAERADVERAIAEARARGSKTISPNQKARTVTTEIEPAVRAAAGRKRAELLALRSDLYSMLSLHDRRKLPTPPETDLEAAIRLDPSDPTLRFFYAHRVDRSAEVREQLEAALVSDPGHVPSLYKLSELARASDRRLEARALLERALAKDPRFERAALALAALRSEGRFEKELALADLEETLGADPAAVPPHAECEIATHRRALGDRTGAERAASAAVARDFTLRECRDLLIDSAIDRSDRAKATALLEESIRLEPWDTGSRIRLAKLLASSAAEMPRALEVIQRAAADLPDATEVQNAAAEMLLMSGARAEALASIERSLAIDPNQPDLRKRRASLAGERIEIEDELSIDASTLLTQPVSEEESAWGAAYLTDRTAVRLYPSGQATRFHQQVVRLTRPDLRDAVRVERIRYTPGREAVEILSAERIRPTGEVIRASRIADEGPEGKVGGMYVDARWKTVLFDDVEPLDLIHIRYRIDSVGQNIFGGFFGDITGLQAGFPKRDVEYVAFAPVERPLHAGMIRTGPPAVTTEDGVQKTRWHFDRLPALEFEPMAPPYPEVGVMVSVSTYKSWDELGRWYTGLFREQLELDEAARRGGREAVRGAKDDAEKIRRLYHYVVKNTRYVGIELGIHGWKPFKASEVHRRRYGDCKDKATLLAALLLDNGIDATIALVRTADRGPAPKDHATMWAFNHAITYVPGADLFLDGTAEFSGSTELPYLDQGAMILIVGRDGRTKLTSPAESKPEDNLNRSLYTARLSDDGSLTLNGEETFFGARASQLRQEYEEPKTRLVQVEKTLTQILPGAQVTSLDFSDLSDLESRVSYRYQAKIPNYGAAEGRRLILPLTLFPHQVANAYATVQKRTYDLFTTYAWSTRNVVRYELPKGYRIVSLPEGVTLDTKYLSLVQTIRRVDGGFETDDTVTLKDRRVPAAEYPAFREACLTVDRALERKVVVER